MPEAECKDDDAKEVDVETPAAEEEVKDQSDMFADDMEAYRS